MNDRPNRGADALIAALKAEGVTFVAGVTGASMFELFDALDFVPEIKGIVVRHERCAVDIADGYARVSGKPGVAMCVQGPGSTNAFSGIVSAYADSIPVLLIQGLPHQNNIDRGAFQDTDIMPHFLPFTQWRGVIATPTRLQETMRRAFSVITATRPRPVVVGIPMNVSGAAMPEGSGDYQPVKQRVLKARPDAKFVEQAAQMLVNAKQPLLYAGAGALWSNAHEELRELAELLGAPVMTTLPGKSVFNERHPLALGVGGFPASSYASKAALEIFPKVDVVLGIGCSFKQQATQYRPVPSAPKLIHIDIDPAEFNKYYPADIALLGDCQSSLRDLIDAVRQYIPTPREWSIAPEIAQLHAEQEEYWKPLLTSDDIPITPQRVIHDLKKVFDPDDTIIMHDSGSSRGYVIHHWIATQPRGVLGVGNQSSMGWSVGACIGAKLAAPDKHVINIIGDGAFGMTGFEMDTAVRYGINTITIILDNSTLEISRGAAERMVGHKPISWQSFDIKGTDYAKVAEGFGALAIRVEKPEELIPAYEKALTANKPVLISIATMQFSRDASIAGGADYKKS